MSDEQVQAHEERLQRLEENSQDFSAHIAKQEVQLDHLTDTVATGFVALNQKLEDLITPLVSKVDDATRKSELLSSRIALFEVEKAKVEKRWANINKVFWIALAGAAGIICQHVVSILINYAK